MAEDAGSAACAGADGADSALVGTAAPPVRRRLVVTAVMLTLFLATLDQTVVGTALPRIVGDLHGANLYSWVVTVYLLSSTITVPLYGRFSDVYGRKPLLLFGVGLFLVGSALCGQSHTMTELILFRGLQGLGAGALFPLTLAVIGDLFPPTQRGRVSGLFGAVFGLSFIAGPFVGGTLTDATSWRWVFYVNLPIGLAALAIIVIALPRLAGRPSVTLRDLDYAGIAVFAVATSFLLLGLTEKGTTTSAGALHGWGDRSVAGYLVGALVLYAVFLLIERRAQEPLIPLGLFRNRSYSTLNIASFFVSFALFATVIFLPLYFQNVRGLSATASGLRIYPLMLGVVLGSTGAGVLISRTRRYKRYLVSAIVLAFVGSLLLTRLRAGSGYWYVAGGMALVGLGVGPTFSGLTVAIQSAVSPQQIGTATSNLTFFRQIGGSVSLAIASTIYAQTLQHQIPQQIASAGLPPEAARAAGGVLAAGRQAAGSVATAVPQPVLEAAHRAQAIGVGTAVWLGVVGALVGFIALVVMPEVPLRDPAQSAAAGPPAPAATSENVSESTPAALRGADR